MAPIDYVRNDRVIRFVRGQDRTIRVEFDDGERIDSHTLADEFTKRLVADGAASQAASLLLGSAEIQAALGRWRRDLANKFQAVPTPHSNPKGFDRIGLEIDDERLAALPLEQALLYALQENGAPHLPIVRLMPVPPRVAQVPFTLPLRLLQLDRRDDFDLRKVTNDVFGTHTRDRHFASVARVNAAKARRFANWSLPAGWKTVDVLQLDRPIATTIDRLFATSAPGEVGTFGWLSRCVDLWRTRLVVIRGRTADMAPLRRFANRLAARGGPAVWLVDGDSPDFAQLLRAFYVSFLHDAPIDLAAAMAGSHLRRAIDQSLIVGCGREELARVSAPGDHIAVLARSLTGFDAVRSGEASGRLWASIAASQRNIRDTARVFGTTVRGLDSIAESLPSLNFDVHEGDGMVPLGKSIGALRRKVRGVMPTIDIRQVADRSGPRFVNPSLSRLDVSTGRTDPILQAGARLELGRPIIFGVQFGPRDGAAPVLDATALLEEPFKWSEGHEGVWLSIGVTGLDFAVTGTAVQEVWLPRHGASDIVEFVVRPTRRGVSQLRYCVYFKADLLQAHRLAALVVDDPAAQAADTSDALAAALGVAADRVRDGGWFARMEYAAAADLATPPAGRDVALSIFANDLGGRRVFTSRGSEGYEVLVANDTKDFVDDVRSQFSAISTDRFGLYAFRQVPNAMHSGTPAQRDDALCALAKTGWALFDAIFKGADQVALAADLAGEGRIVHIAHSLLENVIPWSAIYDRPYDADRKTDGSGLPVLRAVCQAGLPDADGKFPATECGTHPSCPLSPQGRQAASAAGKSVECDSIMCARHFWGFRHILELPPYQDGGDGETAEAADSEHVASAGGNAAGPVTPARKSTTTAGNPAKLLIGYNAGLATADTHLTALQALLPRRVVATTWQDESRRDEFLEELKLGTIDLVYLFCHARGGAADLTVRPPALELQAKDCPPALIRAAAFSGVNLTHNPLFFLNGCNTAAFSPDALSPFIRKLVRDCGAAGAIGTEIPVFELLAGEVARLFLTGFLDGAKAGEALLDVRRNLLARGNPLGLVYTLYAVAELAIVQ
jgi:hypothetical protein